MNLPKITSFTTSIEESGVNVHLECDSGLQLEGLVTSIHTEGNLMIVSFRMQGVEQPLGLYAFGQDLGFIMSIDPRVGHQPPFFLPANIRYQPRALEHTVRRLQGCAITPPDSAEDRAQKVVR